MKREDFTLRSKPIKNGQTLYWWNGRYGFNAFGVPAPALFHSEEEANLFLDYKLKTA